MQTAADFLLEAVTNTESNAKRNYDIYTRYKSYGYQVALVVNVVFVLDYSDIAARAMKTSRELTPKEIKAELYRQRERNRHRYISETITHRHIPGYVSKPKSKKVYSVSEPYPATKIMYMEYSKENQNICDMLAIIVKKVTELKTMPHNDQCQAFLRSVFNISVPKDYEIELLNVIYNIGLYRKVNDPSPATFFFSDVRYDLDRSICDKEISRYTMGEVGSATHKCRLVSEMIPDIINRMEIFNAIAAAKKGCIEIHRAPRRLVYNSTTMAERLAM